MADPVIPVVSEEELTHVSNTNRAPRRRSRSAKSKSKSPPGRDSKPAIDEELSHVAATNIDPSTFDMDPIAGDGDGSELIGEEEVRKPVPHHKFDDGDDPLQEDGLPPTRADILAAGLDEEDGEAMPSSMRKNGAACVVL